MAAERGTLSERASLTDRVAFGVMAGATVALFWKIVFLGRVLYWGDVMLQFLPWRGFANDALRSGQLPLWNPYSFCGEPFLANPQVAVFYPWNVLGLSLSPEHCVSWGALAHTLLAAGGMYLFLKELRLPRPAALLGCLSFACGGFLVSRHQFPSMIDTAVWLPFALLWTHRVVARPTLARGAMLALVTGVHLLAGHAQMSLFIFLLQFVWVLVQLTAGEQGEASSARAGWVALAIFGGCLAAAAQLLPTAEWVGHSTRASLTFAQVTRFSFPWWQVPGLLLPTLFGTPALGGYWGSGNFWETCGYVGLVPTLLAGCGLLRSRRRERWVLAGLVVVALLLAFGRYAPFFGWAMRLVPAIRLFRDPARFLFLCTFALSVLSAFGLEALLDSATAPLAGRAFNRLTSAFAVLCGGACVLAFLGGGPVSGAFRSLFAFCLEEGGKSAPADTMGQLTSAALVGVQLSLILGVLWLGLTCLLTRRASRHEGGWAAAVAPLLVLTVVELWVNGVSLNPTTRRASLEVHPQVAAVLKAEGDNFRCLTPLDSVDKWWGRYANYVRYGDSDAATLAGAIEGFAPNLNLPERVLNASGYNPVRVRWLWDEVQRAEAKLRGTRARAFLRVASVSSLVCFEPHEQTPLVEPLGPALPRATLWARGAVSAESPPALTSRPLAAPPASFGLQSITVACRPRQPATLALSDTFYPGWGADAEGASLTVRPAARVFRAVVLPAQTREVRFVYFPQSLRVGVFLSLLSLFGLAALAAATLGRRQPRP